MGMDASGATGLSCHLKNVRLHPKGGSLIMPGYRDQLEWDLREAI